MLRFERFNTFYIFNLHLDARWGRHNSQRYGGIFSMYRNHWSNTLSTNFSDMDNYKLNSNFRYVGGCHAFLRILH